MLTKIGINGFGRIGRLVFRAAIAQFLFGFGFLAEDFLLCLEDFFLFDCFRLVRGLIHELLHGVFRASDLVFNFLFHSLAAEDIAAVQAAGQCDNDSQDPE